MFLEDKFEIMEKLNDFISVLMPTFNQSAYILNSINSLLEQTYNDWELIVINDASTDNTAEIINTLLPNPKIKYIANDKNMGLGKCLNIGMNEASYSLISYLPSDDFFYKKHLEILINKLNSNSNAILAYSGLQYDYHYNITNNHWPITKKQIIGKGLQLVQVLHKKTEHLWVERSELVSDNLFTLFWKKITRAGIFLPTNEITCQFTNHPKQRHKIINRNFGGGLATYRAYYSVKEPIKFHSISGDFFDESEYYSSFKTNKPNKKGLKILLIGELAYNAERIYALEQHDCQLFGLWISKPSILYTVGPLPFGNVTDIPLKNWKQTVKEIKPDIIYAMQNEHSIELAHEVLIGNTGIPFVWHFKEGFSMARDLGLWEKLIDLYTHSDGQIYIHKLVQRWFGNFLPQHNRFAFIMDGDLAKQDWFKNERSTKLSEQDGEVHTIFVGRPIGITPDDIASLAANKIHVHFYGTYQVMYKDWILKNKELSGRFFHVHPNCFPNNWTREFSKYDAGWLHNFESHNEGDILKITWHDLNMPARMSTIAAAGLPMIMKNNKRHLVASQEFIQKLEIGIFYSDFNELKDILYNKELMRSLQENVWKERMKFSFDYYVPELIQFFKKVIELKKQKQFAEIKLKNSNL